MLAEHSLGYSGILGFKYLLGVGGYVNWTSSNDLDGTRPKGDSDGTRSTCTLAAFTLSLYMKIKEFSSTELKPLLNEPIGGVS